MKIIWYCSWNIRCHRHKSLSFWAICCPSSPLTTWKIKLLKLKKTPEDIIILHILTINDNHMMYGSWDMEYNRQNFLPFYPPMDPENQNFDKMKSTPEDIIILRMCTINESHMMYGSGVQRTELFVIFNHFLPFYPPKNLANQNFKTMKKKAWTYYHFTHVYHNNDNHMM